ncbi:MAG: serine/threonine-protein kinase [Planctomycetia bacterium]|nr:serine/threonine-protein kinase [Planctomycetia bacterium]
MSNEINPNDIVKTKAKDGSNVEFVFKDPKQGGVKDVYFAPDRSEVVAFFRNPLDVSGRERIEKIVTDYRSRIYEQAGGEYWKECFCWPEKIVEYNGMTGIVVPTYQNCFFFQTGNLAGTEKEGKWFASPKIYNRFVPMEEKGSLLGYLRLCLKLSRATRRLHAAGLAHSDLSYKNCLVDPQSGNACIIDIDGLVVPGVFPPDVIGTPDFIAPEVVASTGRQREDRILPSQATDRHALAVLIYQYLFHRHPLRGGKIYSQDNDVQEKMEMGEKALFIEHPNDKSNRPILDDNDDICMPWVDVEKIPYTTAGPMLKTLFDRAFIEGLHDPAQRPTADDWEDAIVKTSDMIQPCSNENCVKKWFIFDNSTRPVCPYCGTPYKGILPLLDFYSSRNGKDYRPDNHRLMVFSGQSLYQWHTNRSVIPNEKIKKEHTTRVGYFSFFKGKWLFVNQTLTSMKNLTTDQPVPIGTGVELVDGLKLQFSSDTNGRIAYIQIAKGT